MVDPETVRRRLRQIDRRVTSLRSIVAEGRTSFLDDPDIQAQAERHLQVTIQAAIDIAIHLLADRSAEAPEDYGSSFLLLADSDIIDDELARRLRLAAGLRNILVHGYLDVDPQRVWDHLNRLVDLVAFAEAVNRFLEDADGTT